MEYLDYSRPSLKPDIKNLTSLLPALIDDWCLPNRRLKLEMLSESQIASGEHGSRSLKELFKYSEDDYSSFLTEEALCDFSQSSTEASPYPLVDLEKQADSSTILLGPISLTPTTQVLHHTQITFYLQ